VSIFVFHIIQKRNTSGYIFFFNVIQFCENSVLNINSEQNIFYITLETLLIYHSLNIHHIWLHISKVSKRFLNKYDLGQLMQWSFCNISNSIK